MAALILRRPARAVSKDAASWACLAAAGFLAAAVAYALGAMAGMAAAVIALERLS